MQRIVVVGASLAGVHAAEALREHGFSGELTLLSAESGPPIDRPPLSKEFLLGKVDADALALRPAPWYPDHGIALVGGTRAVGLDTDAHRLALADGTVLDYDGLVLATGSTARRLPSARPPDARVHVLRDLDDARRLRAALRPGRHLIIAGAGFIGLEVAGVARQLGLDVTLVHHSVAPLARSLGAPVSEWYHQLHERHGVRLLGDCALAAVESRPGGVSCALTSGERITGDLLLMGIGAVPATDWLAGSGVTLTDGAVRCTPELRTSAPDVVAAGDISRWHNPVFDAEMRVAHWTNAIDQGRHAAATLWHEAAPFASVPYFWTDQHGTKMRFVGRAAGATAVHVETHTADRLVVAYTRDGTLAGAVCVGAPRRLAQFRAAIRDRARWEDVAAPAPAFPP